MGFSEAISQFSEVVSSAYRTVPLRDVICLIFILLTFAFVLGALRSQGLGRDTRRWWRYFLVVTSLFFASEVCRAGRLFFARDSVVWTLFYLLTYICMAFGCIMLLVLIFWSYRRLNIFQ